MHHTIIDVISSQNVTKVGKIGIQVQIHRAGTILLDMRKNLRTFKIVMQNLNTKLFPANCIECSAI